MPLTPLVQEARHQEAHRERVQRVQHQLRHLANRAAHGISRQWVGAQPAGACKHSAHQQLAALGARLDEQAVCQLPLPEPAHFSLAVQSLLWQCRVQVHTERCHSERGHTQV